MRKKASHLIILILFTSLTIYAGNFEILEFRRLDADFTAERQFIQDIDHGICSALRIEGNIPDKLKIKERIYKDLVLEGNKYLFFSSSEIKLTLEAPGFQPYILTPPESPAFSQGKVYLLRMDHTGNIDKPSEKPIILALDSFTFRFISCSFTPENNVIIKLEIINHDPEDKQIIITGNTKFYDNLNREWTVNKRELGNKTATFSSIRLRHKIISKIPNDLVLTFYNVNNTATSINLLKLGINDGKIEMRNIPINR